MELTGVGLAIAAYVGNAIDPANLQCAGLPHEATAKPPFVYQSNDDVAS